MNRQNFFCPICGKKWNSCQEFYVHVRLRHQNEPNFNLTCNIQGCGRQYKKFRSYQQHVYRYHKHVTATKQEYDQGESIDFSNANDMEIDSDESQSSDNDDVQISNEDRSPKTANTFQRQLETLKL